MDIVCLASRDSAGMELIWWFGNLAYIEYVPQDMHTVLSCFVLLGYIMSTGGIIIVMTVGPCKNTLINMG